MAQNVFNFYTDRDFKLSSSKVKAELQVSPRFLIDYLTNVERGPKAFIIVDTNLPGAHTRTSVSVNV